MGVSTFVTALITAASIAYQAHEARKAKKKAKDQQKAAEEARKGFIISVEGESLALPVLYGRNKIAGARVYHNVKNNYVHADAPNAQQFHSKMAANIGGSKNEFLYVQQAICQGTINKVVDFTIDDTDRTDKLLEYGYRVNIYKEGNMADPMMVANFSDRDTAVFTDVPYASMSFRLNREEAQYGGVPEVVFYVEGSLVRTVELSNGLYSLSTTRVYSTNPALCLLDYLLSTEYGRGLSESEIDLKSFYHGAQVCNTIVQTGTAASGRILGSYGGSRDLPLYECNMIVDTSKPVRDNIIDILSCMGDADLVWSAGKYKLQLQYPQGLGDLIIAGSITDDDIIADTINIKYPSAVDRMNFCTIKYYDEANDFKENSASWPPKNGPVYPVYLTQDNNVPLEKSFTESGIVSSYHALAKAEELVRVSRNAVSYAFKIRLSSQMYEPGDVVQVSSSAIFINNEYLLIREIAVTSESTADVTAVRYDPAQLAWNAKDDEIVAPRNNYDFTYSSVIGTSIHFVANPPETFSESLGILYWDSPTDLNPLYYIIDVRRMGETTFTNLGTSSSPSFEIFSLKSGNYEFSIRAVYASGAIAEAAVSDIITIEALSAPTNVVFTSETDSLQNISGKVTWTAVNDSRVKSYNIYLYEEGNLTPEFEPIFTNIGNTTDTTFYIPELDTINVIIGVTSVTSLGVESEMGLSGTIVINYPTPPAPTGVSAVNEGTQSESVRISWSIPELRSDGTTYNDHSYSRISRRIAGSGSVFKIIGETSGTSILDTPTEYGTLEYYVELVSKRSEIGPASTIVSAEINFWESFLDSTPPPAPVNLTLSSTFSNIILTWNNPTHDVGGGHYATLVYAAEWPEGALEPSFLETNLVATVPYSEIYAFATGMSKRWVFWIKSMSQGHGVSTNYEGPLNATTGKIANSDLGDAIVEAQNIADNSISNQNFIEGLEGIYYYTGTELPTTNISNTISWGGALYKWDAGSGTYVSAIEAGDISGQLTGDQIADAVLTAAKFAAGVEPIDIFTSIPSTKSTSTISVNGKLYKWDGTAYTAKILGTDAVTADSIEANSITSAKISAGAVGAEEISAGAIITNKLLVMPESLCPDPCFKDVDYWSYGTDAGGWYFESGYWADQVRAPNAALLWSGNIDNKYVRKHLWSRPINLSGSGQVVRLRASIYNGANIECDIIARFKNSSGSILGDIFLSAASYSWFNTYSVQGTIPDNAATVEFIVFIPNDSVVVYDGLIVVSSIRLDLAASAELIVDGSITTSKLAADAVTADKIAANAITAAEIAAGAITADKMAVGAISVGSAAIANGAISNAMIAAAAIDAAKIVDAAINSAKIADASITSAKIASAIQSDNYVQDVSGWKLSRDGTFELNASISGQGRLKITNQLILIYDANGVLRLRIGIW